MSAIEERGEQTYLAGYDKGLEDATLRRPRAFPKLRRERKPSRFRVGYDDGYFDGIARRAGEVKP